MKGILDHVQEIQDSIMMYRTVKDKLELKYLMRSKNNYDSKNNGKFINYKYKVNEKCYLFIGNDGAINRKWRSRWIEMVFVRYVGNFDCILRSQSDNKNYQYCLALVRPKSSENDWLSELDYEKYVKQKEIDVNENELKNSLKFDSSVKFNDGNDNLNNQASKPDINYFNMNNNKP